MAIVGHSARSPGFRVSRRMLTAVLVLFVIYSFAPIFYLVVSATKSNADLFTTFGFWFAPEISLGENIRLLFTHANGVFSTWLFNTFAYSLTIAAGIAVISSLAGYAFAKYNFVGKRAMFAVVLGAVMIPQTALVIPIFLLLTNINLVDTPLAVILPSIVSPFGVFLMWAFIEESVPSDLIDAARVDGAGEFRIFASIAFRLMAPGFATLMLLSFVWSWNNYFLPLVVLNSSKYFPVTVGLSQWYQTATVGSGGAILFSIVLAGSLVSVLPVIAAFLVMQRYWQSGLAAGGVKA